jgi:hypothetical protein
VRPLDAAARAVLAWSARHVDPSHAGWIEAMRGELEEVEGGGLERLVWALGGPAVVLTWRRSALTRPWYSWPVLLRSSSFGIALAAVMVTGIIWSNLVVPSHDSDSEYTTWYVVFYAALPVYFALAGAFAGGGRHPVLAGAATALILTGVVLLTFIVIDNVFLDVVMQQPDKAAGFARSGMTSERDYVNQGDLAIFFILPLFGAIGAGAGALGGQVRQQLARRRAA